MTISHSPRTSVLTALAASLLLLIPAAHAEGNGADGTWSWTSLGRNGGAPRTNTLTLKVEGAKLSGNVSAPGREGKAVETAITDGKLDGDSVAFSVVRDFNGTPVTAKYNGKVSGDKITGKIETVRDGQPQSRDWEAQRAAK